MILFRKFRSLKRKYNQSALGEFNWIIIGIVVIIVLILGFLGFRNYFISSGELHSNWDCFYLTLQLFVLESGALPGIINWELELARFLAPAISAYAAVKAATVIFQEQIQLLRVKFFRNHILVCGLGKRGFLLANRLYSLGYRVVVIEKNSSNEKINLCRELNIIVIIGDAMNKQVLHKASVYKAKYLMAICGNDGVNAEIAVHTREIVSNRSGRELNCLVHIVDPKLCQLLMEREIVAGKIDSFRLEFFNDFDNGARAWLNEYPVFPSNGEYNLIQPHLLIVGLGVLAERLILHLARKWRNLSSLSNEIFRVSIIDKRAKSKLKEINSRYPYLKNVCHMVAKQIDIDSPKLKRPGFLFDKDTKCDITTIFICFDNDSFALSTALMINDLMRDYDIPIIVRMSNEAGLTTLLQGEDIDDSRFAKLQVFGLLDSIYKPELLLAGTYEILAQAVHEDYVLKQKKKEQTIQNNSSIVQWDNLPEELKESNRNYADHIGIKLKSINCDIAPIVNWDSDLFKFTDKEIEFLAEMEHKRWMTERLEAGWTFAHGEKNIEKKTSPYLVPMNELTEEIKELDRNTIREMPLFLSNVGFQIYRIKV